MKKKIFTGVLIGGIALTMVVLTIFEIEVPLKISLPIIIGGIGGLIWFGWFRK